MQHPPERLHLIEPTLEGDGGHCHSFVHSLCQGAIDHPVTVWCGRNAHITLPSNVETQRWFYRRIRKFQVYFLYRRLLRQTGRIFVSTATRLDLMWLDLAAADPIEPHKVFLYIHWLKTSPRKVRQLATLAQRQPDIAIFTPTPTMHDTIRAAGFQDVRLVPYPITPFNASAQSPEDQAFKHLLFAGAARRDKGFHEVVNLVEFLKRRGSNLPVSLQTSPDHYAKFDEITQQDLARLDEIEYPHLDLHSHALPPHEYHAMFVGAICLQLYWQHDFADRISGITLDSLSAGSPIVTLSGTWMARIVMEFDAGVVIDSSQPESVMAAVMQIQTHYARYRANALAAGQSLQDRHHAKYLFQELMA